MLGRGLQGGEVWRLNSDLNRPPVLVSLTVVSPVSAIHQALQEGALEDWWLLVNYNAGDEAVLVEPSSSVVWMPSSGQGPS